MRHVVLVILAFAAIALIPASAIAKSCPSGYTHAVIGGEQKCLHAGEYCSRYESNQYHRYHFDCEDVRGTYRLERS
jgi:hypothetical protein